MWLTLEHKGIPYDFKLLSFDGGDTKKPEFLKVNPRGQVPAIVHDGFALFESAAICEYLEERFPDRPLLPMEPRDRAPVRRMVLEVEHVSKADTPLIEQTLFRAKDVPEDPAKIAAAKETVLKELAIWDARLADGSRGGDYLAGTLSLADFTLFPFVRALRRIDLRQPQKGSATACRSACRPGWTASRRCPTTPRPPRRIGRREAGAPCWPESSAASPSPATSGRGPG